MRQMRLDAPDALQSSVPHNKYKILKYGLRILKSKGNLNHALPDNGSPFFQLARTVIQQANFSLGIHIEEPERILSHYDRVQHLLHAFVKLSHIYRNVPTLIDWQNTAIQTLHQIVAHLESINEYAYDIGNE